MTQDNKRWHIADGATASKVFAAVRGVSCKPNLIALETQDSPAQLCDKLAKAFQNQNVLYIEYPANGALDTDTQTQLLNILETGVIPQKDGDVSVKDASLILLTDQCAKPQDLPGPIVNHFTPLKL